MLTKDDLYFSREKALQIEHLNFVDKRGILNLISFIIPMLLLNQELSMKEYTSIRTSIARPVSISNSQV